MFRVTDSMQTTNSFDPVMNAHPVSQRMSHNTSNPLMTNMSINNNGPQYYNTNHLSTNQMQDSIGGQEPIAQRQSRPSVVSTNTKLDGMTIGKDDKISRTTGDEYDGRNYYKQENFDKRIPEYSESIVTNSNKDLKTIDFERNPRHSHSNMVQINQTQQINVVTGVDSNPNMMNKHHGLQQEYGDNPQLYDQIKPYSVSDKNLNNMNQRAQTYSQPNIYPTYSNATGSTHFIKLRETSQQQIPPIPYDLDLDEIEAKSKTLEDDLLNSTAKENSELLFTQKNVSGPIQLSHTGPAVIREGYQRYSMLRDSSQNQSGMREARHSVTSGNNYQLQSFDQKQAFNKKQKEQQYEYDEYQQVSDIDPNMLKRNNMMGQNAFTAQKQPQQPNNIMKQRSYSVDQNIMTNNLGSRENKFQLEASKNTKPQPSNRKVNIFKDQPLVEPRNVDYKALYEQEQQKVQNLEIELKTTTDRIKQLKTEKVSLIQNYEKLIKKLHSMKQVENEYTKAMVEKSNLEKEVNHLEERVIKVKEGTLTDSIMDSLRNTLSFGDKNSHIKQQSRLQDSAQKSSSRVSNPINQSDSKDTGIQTSNAFQINKMNPQVEQLQRTSIHQQNMTPKLNGMNPHEQRPIRSQSTNDMRQVTGKVFKDLNVFMNTLESNVCEVILNGEIVYDKRLKNHEGNVVYQKQGNIYEYEGYHR